MAKRTCTYPGCKRPYYAKGCCNLHWRRERNNGDPGKVRQIRNDPVARFWSYVTKTEGCWLWTGKIEATGYGRFWDGQSSVGAHRFSYELLVGPIPDGLTLDHLCHNRDPSCPNGSACLHRRCVRPGHLEPATRQENNLRGNSYSGRNARKTHCPQGHPYDEANTYWYKGWRKCRICLGIPAA